MRRKKELRDIWYEIPERDKLRPVSDLTILWRRIVMWYWKEFVKEAKK